MGIHLILRTVCQYPQQCLLDVVSGNAVHRRRIVSYTIIRKLNTAEAFQQKNGKTKTNIFNKLWPCHLIQ
jgi:hypothetical protein